MRYIIEADDTTKALIQDVIATITTPKTPRLIPIVQDEEGRTTPIHVVAEFYDEQLRTEFPQLLTWDQLDDRTHTGIAIIMAGYIAWQFPQHYRMNMEDTYSDIISNHPEAVGQGHNHPAPQPPAVNPGYALTSTTTENVIASYVSIMEGTVDGEHLTPWEDLPDTERTRLVQACQKALLIDPADEIIDVLDTNIDWKKYAGKEPED